MKRTIVIGGENYYPPSFIIKNKLLNIRQSVSKRYPDKHLYFTSGGLSSLFVIIDSINFSKEQLILLPSYLCPSMLIPLKEKGINYKFYKITKKLEIDLNDLMSKADNTVAAICFINYFGVRSNLYNSKELKFIKNREIILIEDAVQSFFSEFNFIGDYIFNSFRKFTPFDGSVIISNNIIKGKIENNNFKYQFSKTIGQWIRWFRITTDIPLDHIYVRLFQFSNKQYYKEISTKFTHFNNWMLSRFDFNEMIFKRRENFQYLLEELNEYSLFINLQKETVPLGFPILIKNRDYMRTELSRINIFCPIHWQLSTEIDKIEFSDSWYLSDNIMTIPINEKTNNNELAYLIEQLKTIDHRC